MIFAGDRGSAFLGTVFRTCLATHGVQPRMTGGGAPAETAHMESFFHSLKADVIHGRSCQTVTELRRVRRRYLPYYNPQRLHSALDYRSPVDYARSAA